MSDYRNSRGEVHAAPQYLKAAFSDDAFSAFHKEKEYGGRSASVPDKDGDNRRIGFSISYFGDDDQRQGSGSLDTVRRIDCDGESWASKNAAPAGRLTEEEDKDTPSQLP